MYEKCNQCLLNLTLILQLNIKNYTLILQLVTFGLFTLVTFKDAPENNVGIYDRHIG